MGRTVILFKTAVLGAVLAAVLCATAYGDEPAQFVSGTSVNGLGIGKMSVDEAKSRLEGFYDSDYKLTIKRKDGTEEYIKGSDIGYKVTVPDGLAAILNQQNAAGRVSGPAADNAHTMQMSAAYDEGALNAKIAALSCLSGSDIVTTRDARLSAYEAGKEFTVIPEVEGNDLDAQKTAAAIKAAVASGQMELNLKDSGCYNEVKLRAGDKSMTALRDTMNRYRNMTVTYIIGAGTETQGGGTGSQGSGAGSQGGETGTSGGGTGTSGVGTGTQGGGTGTQDGGTGTSGSGTGTQGGGTGTSGGETASQGGGTGTSGGGTGTSGGGTGTQDGGAGTSGGETGAQGVGTEILDGGTICSWLSINGDNQVVADPQGVAGFVQTLAEKYNTSGKVRTFKTVDGRELPLTGPYGWTVNQADEVQALTEYLKSADSRTRELSFSQTAAVHGDADWGSTYVEIDMKGQHAYMFQEGNLVWDAPCVTGNVSKKHTTPEGIYSLAYKATDRILKGEKKADGTYEYESHVDYWMPFNGGIGLHDANWRGKFGGSIFQKSGSHGCVNLPPKKVPALYDMVFKGMPVICHN